MKENDIEEEIKEERVESLFDVTRDTSHSSHTRQLNSR